MNEEAGNVIEFIKSRLPDKLDIGYAFPIKLGGSKPIKWQFTKGARAGAEYVLNKVLSAIKDCEYQLSRQKFLIKELRWHHDFKGKGYTLLVTKPNDFFKSYYKIRCNYGKALDIEFTDGITGIMLYEAILNPGNHLTIDEAKEFVSQHYMDLVMLNLVEKEVADPVKEFNKL